MKSSDFSPNFPSKIQQSSKGDFVLPFDLSYELDLWGRVRRSVAAAREEAQATAADYGPQSSVSRRNSPWTISNCAAPTLRSNFSTIR